MFLTVLSLSAQGGYCFNDKTQVVISTGAPAGLEKSFLATTTTQYLAKLTANPLAANTYSLILYGPNPAYQAPAPPPTTLEQALSLGSSVYVYGFANGMTYERGKTEGTIGAYGNLCGSATSFMLTQASTTTFNRSTCEDTLATIENFLFQLSLSTPPVIPQAVP